MSEKTQGICGCACCLVVMTIILILMSMEAVEPTEFAILRSKINQNIDDETYIGGRHWTGLWSTFIRYPSIQVPIEFSDQQSSSRGKLQTRTKEGLDLSLHFSLQYQLIQAELPKLYRLLETDYDRVFERLARNSVLEVASDYPAADYWNNRVAVGAAMEANLNANLKKVHAQISGFQLLKINLPDVFENEIVKTQVMKQEEKTYTSIREVNLNQQKVRNIRAEGERAVSNINAKANADATIETNKGEGMLVRQNIEYATKAMKDTQDKLAFAAPKTALLQYFKYSKLKNLSKNTKNRLVYGGISTTLTQ